MKRYLRLPIVIIVFVAAWLLFTSPFAHGIIIGALVAPALLFGALTLFIKRITKRDGGGLLEPPALPNASWDYVMELADLEGKPFSFAHATGSVLVLNFWATWCSPCVAELPSLKRLQEQTTELGVQFGFITKEAAPAVLKFLEKKQLDLPIYTLAGEPPECFQGRGIPVTFVLDKSGMIALRHFGAAAWDDDRVVAFVRGLAAQPNR